MGRLVQVQIIESLQVFPQAIVTAVVLSATDSSTDEAEYLIAQREAAKAASRALGGFAGVQRRFEWIGMGRGFQLFDDYAHHPTEIHAVVRAVRQKFPGQPLWLVFQPHTYRYSHIFSCRRLEATENSAKIDFCIAQCLFHCNMLPFK